MKKGAAVLLVLTLSAGLTACGSNNNAEVAAGGASAQPQQSQADLPAAKELLDQAAKAGSGVKSYALQTEQQETHSGETIDSPDSRYMITSQITIEPPAAYQRIELELAGAMNDSNQLQKYITSEAIYSARSEQWYRDDKELYETQANLREFTNIAAQLQQIQAAVNDMTVTGQGSSYILTGSVKDETARRQLTQMLLNQASSYTPGMQRSIKLSTVEEMTISYTLDAESKLPTASEATIRLASPLPDDETKSRITDMKITAVYSDYDRIEGITVPEEVKAAAM
ncbi:DUF6612 family protein [Paenibacillus sp. Z6-24]